MENRCVTTLAINEYLAAKKVEAKWILTPRMVCINKGTIMNVKGEGRWGDWMSIDSTCTK